MKMLLVIVLLVRNYLFNYLQRYQKNPKPCTLYEGYQIVRAIKKRWPSIAPQLL